MSVSWNIGFNWCRENVSLSYVVFRKCLFVFTFYRVQNLKSLCLRQNFVFFPTVFYPSVVVNECKLLISQKRASHYARHFAQMKKKKIVWNWKSYHVGPYSEGAAAAVATVQLKWSWPLGPNLWLLQKLPTPSSPPAAGSENPEMQQWNDCLLRIWEAPPELLGAVSACPPWPLDQSVQ